MANKPSEANFFPDAPVYPEMGTFQPVYGKFDLTTYIQGASDYEIMAFLVGKYNACLEAYDKVTKLSTDTITAAHQLQEWINNWFDNLDVQEELNKKIDNMVQDGSFGRLLHQTFDAQINQQTTNAVTQWLVANVTPTGSAVVVDKTLSIEGAAADAKATGELKEDIVDYNLYQNKPTHDIVFSYTNVTQSLTWEKGSISPIDGSDRDYAWNRTLRFQGYITMKHGDKIFLPSNIHMCLFLYDINEKFEGQVTDSWINEYEHTGAPKKARLYLGNVDNSDIPNSSDNFMEYKFNVKILLSYENNNQILWEEGHITFDDGLDYDVYTNDRIRSNMIFVTKGTLIVPYIFACYKPYFFDLNKQFIGNDETLELYTAGFNRYSDRASTFVIPFDCYVRFVYKYQYNENWHDYFNTLKEFSDTFRIIPPNEEVPEYFKDEVSRKFNDVSGENKYFNVTFTTDTHEYSYHDKCHVWCAEQTSSYLLNGGDIISLPRKTLLEVDRVVRRHIEEYVKCKVPVILTKGNHEMSENSMYTNEKWFNSTQRALTNKDFIYNQNNPYGGYFYVDDEDKKVRIICINTSQNNNGTHTISDAQIYWLGTKALTLSDKVDEEKWTVFVLGHIHIMDNIDSVEKVATNDEKYVSSMFASARNKKTVPKAYGYTYNFDFSNAKYNFSCYVCGHVHNDDVRCLDGYMHIVTTCDHPIDDTDGYERVMDTIKEYALDIMSFDTENQLLRCLRVGVGYDRYIHYDVKEVSSTLSLTTELSNVTWSSDNNSVATISNGVVNKVSNGFATIKATDENGKKEYFLISCIN